MSTLMKFEHFWTYKRLFSHQKNYLVTSDYFLKRKDTVIKLAMEDLLNNQLWLTIFETCDKEYLKYKIYNETSF